MKRFLSKMRGLAVEEEGQDMIEYALLGAFIAIVAVAVLILIGPEIERVYNKILTELQKA